MAEAATVDLDADLNNLTMSEEVEPLVAGVKTVSYTHLTLPTKA